MRIADHYQRARAELMENAEAIAHNLTHLNTPEGLDKKWDCRDLLAVAERLAAAHDDVYGGFGGAPKFPCGMLLEFLLSIVALPGGEGLKPRVEAIFEKSLTAMAYGGIYDQVGAGFMRYAVDREWKTPHFEKMLYDNALLLSTYAKGYGLTKNPLCKAVIEETVEWLETTMRSPEGLFYTAQDAETVDGEGAVYKWRMEEVLAVLGPDEGGAFARAYGIDRSDLLGKGVHPAFWGTWEDRTALADARRRLKAVRDKRPQPAVDPKTLLFWNALLVIGLVEAGSHLADLKFLQKARTLLDALLETFERQGVLYGVAYATEARRKAGLTDYAALAAASLAVAGIAEFLEKGASTVYLGHGVRLTQAIMAHFGDPSGVGYFDTPVAEPAVVTPRKSWLDNAIPSGHSLLIGVFAKLYALTGEGIYAQAEADLRRAYGGLIGSAPSGIAYALRALAESKAGLCVITVNQLEPITCLPLIAQNPETSFFIKVENDPNRSPGYERCQGGICYPQVSECTLVESFKTK